MNSLDRDGNELVEFAEKDLVVEQIVDIVRSGLFTKTALDGLFDVCEENVQQYSSKRILRAARKSEKRGAATNVLRSIAADIEVIEQHSKRARKSK